LKTEELAALKKQSAGSVNGIGISEKSLNIAWVITVI